MPTQDHEEYSNRNLHIRNSKRRRFAGMVSHIDDAIGRIVHKLRSKNRMWDNTLMILLSDNGGQVTQAASNYPFRGSKSTAWERAVHEYQHSYPEAPPFNDKGYIFQWSNSCYRYFSNA